MQADGIKNLREEIDQLLKAGQHEAIKNLLSLTQGMLYDNDLGNVWIMIPVCEKEKAHDQRTVFEKAAGLEAFIDRFTRLKFYLRRIEFDVMDDSPDEFYQFLVSEQVSSYELLASLDRNVVHKEKVMQAINKSVQV